MYRSMSALSASLCLLCAMSGCGDDGGDPPKTTTGISNVFTPPPVIDDPDGNGAEPSPLYDRWGACSSASDCLPGEQCIRGITEKYSVCLSPCATVDDCTDPSIPVNANFTAFMTCTEFQGAKRCILGCVSTAQCIAGMSCVTGACVWKP